MRRWHCGTAASKAHCPGRRAASQPHQEPLDGHLRVQVVDAQRAVQPRRQQRLELRRVAHARHPVLVRLQLPAQPPLQPLAAHPALQRMQGPGGASGSEPPPSCPGPTGCKCTALRRPAAPPSAAILRAPARQPQQPTQPTLSLPRTSKILTWPPQSPSASTSALLAPPSPPEPYPSSAQDVMHSGASSTCGGAREVCWCVRAAVHGLPCGRQCSAVQCAAAANAWWQLGAALVRRLPC